MVGHKEGRTPGYYVVRRGEADNKKSGGGVANHHAAINMLHKKPDWQNSCVGRGQGKQDIQKEDDGVYLNLSRQEREVMMICDYE